MNQGWCGLAGRLSSVCTELSRPPGHLIHNQDPLCDHKSFIRELKGSLRLVLWWSVWVRWSTQLCLLSLVWDGPWSEPRHSFVRACVSTEHSFRRARWSYSWHGLALLKGGASYRTPAVSTMESENITRICNCQFLHSEKFPGGIWQCESGTRDVVICSKKEKEKHEDCWVTISVFQVLVQLKSLLWVTNSGSIQTPKSACRAWAAKSAWVLSHQPSRPTFQVLHNDPLEPWGHKNRPPAF